MKFYQMMKNANSMIGLVMMDWMTVEVLHTTVVLEISMKISELTLILMTFLRTLMMQCLVTINITKILKESKSLNVIIMHV